MKNFLIAFQATQELTEALALALGLGAVQGGGNIRLRHLGPPETAQLAHQGYGRLKTDDLLWAECVAVGFEAPDASFAELAQAVAALPDRELLRGKRALVFGPAADASPPSAASSVAKTLTQAGMRLLEAERIAGELSPERMRQTGNRLAAMM